MKYILINDEHELFDYMMADLIKENEYGVCLINRLEIPGFLMKLHNFHYSNRLNKFFEFPFKRIWNCFYTLHKYPYSKDEEYIIIFMNGSLRNHYQYDYLKKLKKKHKNVKLALLLFDKSIYFGAQRSLKFLDLFDYKFSFDKEDCDKYNMDHFYNCFSLPTDLYFVKEKESSAFFVGNSVGRLSLLTKSFKKLCTNINNCRFYITAVPNDKIENINGIIYNQEIPFHEEMLMSYNTNCIIEILREGQVGISLRVCEAIAFNKKLLTNNKNLREMPFYNEKYMMIFEEIGQKEIDFIKNELHVEYKDNNIFSPLEIIKKIERTLE